MNPGVAPEPDDPVVVVVAALPPPVTVWVTVAGAFPPLKVTVADVTAELGLVAGAVAEAPCPIKDPRPPLEPLEVVLGAEPPSDVAVADALVFGAPPPPSNCPVQVEL
jgi:hypothetical protein